MAVFARELQQARRRSTCTYGFDAAAMNRYEGIQQHIGVSLIVKAVKLGRSRCWIPRRGLVQSGTLLDWLDGSA